VLDDVDPKEVAPKLLASAMFNAGQGCKVSVPPSESRHGNRLATQGGITPERLIA
jgi:hypothetical protein